MLVGDTATDNDNDASYRNNHCLASGSQEPYLKCLRGITKLKWVAIHRVKWRLDVNRPEVFVILEALVPAAGPRVRGRLTFLPMINIDIYSTRSAFGNILSATAF